MHRGDDEGDHEQAEAGQTGERLGRIGVGLEGWDHAKGQPGGDTPEDAPLHIVEVLLVDALPCLVSVLLTF